RHVDKRRGSAEGEVVDQQLVIQVDVDRAGELVRGVVDDLYAGRGLRRRQCDERTTRGQYGKEAECRTVAVDRGIQEAGGDHAQGLALQAERGQRREIRGDRHRARGIAYVDRVVERAELKVAGKFTVGDIIHDG